LLVRDTILVVILPPRCLGLRRGIIYDRVHDLPRPTEGQRRLSPGRNPGLPQVRQHGASGAASGMEQVRYRDGGTRGPHQARGAAKAGRQSGTQFDLVESASAQRLQKRNRACKKVGQRAAHQATADSE